MALMQSPTLLKGDNTIPGVKIPKEILDQIPGILKACRDFGLDFYDTIVEFLDYDEISEVAAYGGFPVRYPHWQFGEQYEDLSQGYKYGMHRIYEMVINTSPCYIYCLDSNTIVDHVTVIAHATGHNDFFKNNVFFSQTSRDMMNELANHGSRIRRIMTEWGKEEVGRFIDKILCVDTLIDPAKAWLKRKCKEAIPDTKRKYSHPRRLKVDRDYMEDWINTKEWIEQERERIRLEEIERNIGIFQNPDKDIMGYIREHAPFRPWQQAVFDMLYGECMYFAPQRQTKCLNEGWASFTDSHIMARCGFALEGGIVEYAKHKAGVLGGRSSMNPYKLGYTLLMDVEERWNKGQFGREYEDCQDSRAKEKWDKRLGLGHEKVFEVRQFYDDVTFISEFFTEEFCNKYEFYQWAKFPDGTYKIVDRDWKNIRRLLLGRYINGGLPTIKLADPNYKGKRIFLMEHSWEGRILHPGQTKDTMRALSWLWQGPSAMLTKDKDGRPIMYYCEEDKVEIKTDM